MRLILAIFSAASLTASALAADLSANDVRILLGMAGVNPGTSREIDGELRVIKSVEVEHGKRKGEFVIRVQIDGAHYPRHRQAGP